MDQMDLCNIFAQTLQGDIMQENPCTVKREREIKVDIEGRLATSLLVLYALFSFEDVDEEGRALNLGETVILPVEIDPFITALEERGIEVTALHNHWLNDNPRTLFIHFFSVESPITFARKVNEAFNLVLEPPMMS